MKKRIKEIMTELWEAHLDFRKSRQETEQGYLTLNYDTLFSEAISCWRGERAGMNKYNKKYPISEKQSDFIKKNEKELKSLGFDVNNIQYGNDANKIISEFIKLKKSKTQNESSI